MIDFLKDIEEFALSEFIMSQESIHGVDHWHQVKENGIFLSHQPGVDTLVVSVFSLLHDCKRVEDWEDPEHGERSAELVRKVRHSVLKPLSNEQIEQLWWACFYHNKGIVHSDLTIGSCFDADRLELSRCGIVPKVELMSTPLGKRIATKMAHSFICTR